MFEFRKKLDKVVTVVDALVTVAKAQHRLARDTHNHLIRLTEYIDQLELRIEVLEAETFDYDDNEACDC